jgi:5-hydroxyisourate hydrolase
MAELSIHGVDVTRAVPAAGMRVVVTRSAGGEPVFDGTLGRQGATGPAIDGLDPGAYEVAFHVADWYRGQGVALADPPFLDVTPFRFAIADAGAHYHLPFKFTPWGFSLFRGS